MNKGENPLFIEKSDLHALIDPSETTMEHQEYQSRNLGTSEVMRGILRMTRV